MHVGLSLDGTRELFALCTIILLLAHGGPRQPWRLVIAGAMVLALLLVRC